MAAWAVAAWAVAAFRGAPRVDLDDRCGVSATGGCEDGGPFPGRVGSPLAVRRGRQDEGAAHGPGGSIRWPGVRPAPLTHLSAEFGRCRRPVPDPGRGVPARVRPVAGVTAEEIDGVPYAERIAVLGRERTDTVAVTFVDHDGSRRPLTWGHLDRRSNQLGRAMAARGVGLGDRVGLELPNSVEMVEATLATWKVGASPVPVRWDLPEWERGRVADVLGATLMVGEDADTLFAEADALPADPLPAGRVPERERHLLERIDRDTEDHHGPQPGSAPRRQRATLSERLGCRRRSATDPGPDGPVPHQRLRPVHLLVDR